MELHEIRVTIDKAGNVRMEVNGVKGTSCLDITKAIEEASHLPGTTAAPNAPASRKKGRKPLAPSVAHVKVDSMAPHNLGRYASGSSCPIRSRFVAR